MHSITIQIFALSAEFIAAIFKKHSCSATPIGNDYWIIRSRIADNFYFAAQEIQEEKLKLYRIGSTTPIKTYIVELEMVNASDGYYNVVVAGEIHLNRTKIASKIQYFTRQAGYSFCDPEDLALANAQAIADGLNAAIHNQK